MGEVTDLQKGSEELVLHPGALSRLYCAERIPGPGPLPVSL